MKNVFTLSSMFLLFLTAGSALAQMPDLEGVTINSYHVAGNVYMLEATRDVAGNIAVSTGPDGILLVDTQFAPLAGQIRATLKEISDGEVEFVINTHYHDDHSDGNKVFGESATIITHTNTRKHHMKNPEETRPDITFDDSLSVYFNGEEIRLIHFPSSHTGTDVVVFFTRSNVVHMGDLLNSGIWSFPTVDLGSGGSIMGLQKSIKKLIQIIPDNAKIIPGHYEISDREGLKMTYEMLVETTDIVRTKKEAGMSLEQIKREGLPPQYDAWGTAFTNAETWIENIYRALEKE